MADITGLPLSTRVLFVQASQLFIAVVLSLLTVNLYMRYRERKLLAGKYLTLVSLFLTLTSCMQAIGVLFLETPLGVTSLGWGLAFGCSAIANIFLYVFMLEIFSTGRKAGGTRFTIFVIVESAVAVLMPIFAPLSNILAIFQLLLLAVLSVHLVFALSLYVTLIRMTTRSINQTASATARRGFSIIRLAGFAIVFAYIFFVMDRVWQIMLEPEGYTIWVLFGWISAGITGILLYLGFVLPTRLRRETAQV